MIEKASAFVIDITYTISYTHTVIQVRASTVSFMSRSRGGDRGLDPSEKSQVAIGFLRNTDMDPLQIAIGCLGSNFFSREVH